MINDKNQENFKNFIANSFVSKLIYEKTEDFPSYIVIGKSSVWNDENNVQEPNYTTDEIVNFKKEIICGKRINSNDIAFLIKRLNWKMNTIYDMYNDIDENLIDKKFFVINSNNDVYKCIYNNNYFPSSIEPTIKSINIFKTSDNYVWKYMFTVDNSLLNKFNDENYIPYTANNTIISNSLRTIDSINIEYAGGQYDKYVSLVDISSVVTNNIFKISSNFSSLSDERGFYNLYDINVISGTGTGQSGNIVDYISNTSGKFIFISSPINNPPLNTSSKLNIAPRLKVLGDGENFYAYPTVNTISGINYIETIEIVNKGGVYNFANVYIETPSSSNNNAKLRAIISPENGHGNAPLSELYSNTIAISISLSNSENETIPLNLDYRQSALTTYFDKNKTLPEYLNFNSSNGISNTQNAILINNANSYFSVGDNVVYRTDTGNTVINGLTNNKNYFISYVNSSSVNLSETINSNNIVLISSSISETGHKLCTNTVFSYNTFSALNKLGIQNLTNNFIINEIIYGKNSNSYATIVTSNNDISNNQTNLYVSYISGNNFSNGEIIQGLTSNNSAILNSIINSDIKNFSSNNKILALNNFKKISRTSNTSEQIIFTFNS